MLVIIILICIVLSFSIIVTIYYDKNGDKCAFFEEKMTDDVKTLFPSDEDKNN